MATYSSILAWKIPRTEEPRRLWGHIVHEVTKESDVTNTFLFFFFHFAEACNFNQVSFVCRRLFIFFFGLFVFPLPWGNDLRKHCCHCSVTQSCPTP